MCVVKHIRYINFTYNAFTWDLFKPQLPSG